MKSKIILTIGAANSGKTTWAKEQTRNDIWTVRICPEEMTQMLRGYPMILPAGKKSLRIGIESLIISLISNNYNIVLDTRYTLELEYIEYIVNTFSPYTNIYYKVFDEDLETLKHRDLKSAMSGSTINTQTYTEIRKQVDSVSAIKPILIGMSNSKLIKELREPIACCTT